MAGITNLLTDYRSANLMDLTVLESLRKDLRLVKPNDLITIDDHKEFLRLLSGFRTGLAKSDELKGDNYPELLLSLLSVGVDGLYSNDLRFMFELIQNVDDCDYSDPSNAVLDIHFNSKVGQIVLSYNEKGFLPEHVFNITGTAEAAKNISADKVEIGEKGIGFKSVFGVADKVLIQSGKFSFELHKENYSIPIPKYDGYDEVAGTRLTLYVRPELVSSIYQLFIEEYCKKDALLNKNPVLFLNKLTKLHLYIDDNRGLSFSVSRSTSPSKFNLSVEEDVAISVDLHNGVDSIHQEVSCLRYTMPVIYNKQMCQARYGVDTAFDEKKMFLQVVVPIPSALKGADAIKHGTLYSFLPTQVRLSAPIICHIPFKLSGSREYVDPQKNPAWFIHSCDEFEQMLAKVYIDLASRVKEDIVLYLPKRNDYLFIPDSEKVACLKRQQFFGEKYLQLPVFFTVNEHFKNASEVFLFAWNEEIQDPIATTKLLCEKRELFYTIKLPKHLNPGIAEVHEVTTKLFNRAMLVPEVTEPILQVLSATDSFSFVKHIEGLTSCVFAISQIQDFAKSPKCASAFREISVRALSKSRRPGYFIEKDYSQIRNIANIDSNNGTLSIEDFDRRASDYLSQTGFNYLALSNVPDDFFFAAGNILALSATAGMNSLTEFCRSVDEKGTFAAILRLRRASIELNEASDDLTEHEYMKLLRSNRNSIRRIYGDEVYKNYIRIINEAGTDPERYINELLQNADDCKYPPTEVPSFDLSISGDKLTIITQYNEIGFTKDNVRSITAIGESTKKRLIPGTLHRESEIGEKGVGFKSVFAIAQKVEIHSGNFHFALDSQTPTIPSLLGQHIDVQTGTKMVFALKAKFRHDFFTEERVLQLCRCLHKLKHIKLGSFEIFIEDEAAKRTVTVNGKKFEYRTVDYSFVVKDTTAIKERENLQRHINQKQVIHCYIPISNAIKGYNLYSGLPTKVLSKIPMIIDAPFELTTSRDEILDNSWNHVIRDEVHNAIAHTIEVLKDSLGNLVLRFLNFKKDGDTLALDIFNDPKLNKGNLLSKLQNQTFMHTYKKGVFVSPHIKPYKLPEVIDYLVSKGENPEYSLEKLVQVRGNRYDYALSYFGIKEIPIAGSMLILERCYHKYLSDEKFRSLLYTFLFERRNELRNYHNKLLAMRFIPVKGKQPNALEFVSWSKKIYVKDSVSVSPSNCFILHTQSLPKQTCEQILGVNINELNNQLEVAIYREELNQKFSGNISTNQMFVFIMREFSENRKMLLACKDILRINLHLIPFLNERKQLCKGHLFISNEPEGYYEGNIFPAHIINKECTPLAQFIGVKNISEVHFDELDITAPLIAEDIESLRDDHIVNGFAILEQCRRNGLISQKLLIDYQLIGLAPVSVDCDVDTVLNKPVSNPIKLKNHMAQILSNPALIEPRQVFRTVHYAVPKKGKEFEINNREIRSLAIERYSPMQGYCVCQMCKTAKLARYIEVNNVQRHPKYYWQECGVALCLECSKHFEELRENKTIHDRFINAIRKADPKYTKPIEIAIGNETITFSQTHIAELQEILQHESKSLASIK